MEEEKIGVTCPFTGREDLEVPGDYTWANTFTSGRNQITYFHNRELENSLAHCVEDALGDYYGTYGHTIFYRATFPMLKLGMIRHVGDWWFVKTNTNEHIRLLTAFVLSRFNKG